VKADRSRSERRRGFTVVELVVAIAVSAIVVITVTSVLSRVSRSRDAARLRLEAVSRANAALDSMRQDLAAVVRDEDLYYTRLLLRDGLSSTEYGAMERDEVLIYSNRLRPIKRDAYQGEGGEYETQYRIIRDGDGDVLWLRRDPAPDDNGEGGGIALPVVEGVVGVSIEAYDGESWYPDWDSDSMGLPWALRITVTATGDAPGSEPSPPNRALAVLRTQVPIDRIVPPPPPAETEGEDGLGALGAGDGAAGADGAGAGGASAGAATGGVGGIGGIGVGGVGGVGGMGGGGRGGPGGGRFGSGDGPVIGGDGSNGGRFRGSTASGGGSVNSSNRRGAFNRAANDTRSSRNQ
jgi:type II secretion system protein J